jgi:DNA-binding LacI/PurR family transcriptional regulator
VSRALVSIVIRGVPGASEGTRQRVLHTAAELGYRPDSRARLLSRSRSQLLGVVFGVQHPFHGDLVEGLYLAAEGAGYEIALSAVTPSRDEARAAQTLLHDRCEALILLGPQRPARQLAELASQLPVVVVARPVREPAIDVVRTADHQGLHLAVDHLVALGHRRIVHVDGGSAPGSADRRRGYRTAMRRHGLAQHSRILAGGLTEESGAAAARQLLQDPVLPSAAAVFNDHCAIGMLDTLLRAGVSVPDDISLVGYDDSRLARLSTVNLTTVGQDVRVMADLAVARAIARLTGQPVSEREIVIQPTLVVRATTAPPRRRRAVNRPARFA